MRVVIVGGSGNISASIVPLLLQKGHEVTCFNRGTRNTEWLPKGVRCIVGDRKDREAYEKIMQAEKFDAAIDMICFNAEDAQSSLRAFHGVRHFIQCSTVCTYGFDFRWMPVTEDHPLKPKCGYGAGKVAADNVFLSAWHHEGFPVTIIKPSTTYGPQIGMLRQLSRNFSWIDRIKKGKPLVVSGDGLAIHQFLHVDDAAKGFAGALFQEHCFGQVYNLVRQGYATWVDYHKTAMRILGKEVELVGVPMATLNAVAGAHSWLLYICGFNGYCSCEKINRDIPEFQPAISLEAGMAAVFEYMARHNMIPDSDKETWEDDIIKSQKRLGV